MNIELTDLKRYELEKDSIISVLLAAAQTGTPMTSYSLAFSLNIDIETVNRLIAALRDDQIIK